MTDDLVKRLREMTPQSPFAPTENFSPHAAADRIDALERERDVSNELGRALEEDAGQLRERLAKAVEALRVLLATAYADDHAGWQDALKEATAVLTEIEKS